MSDMNTLISVACVKWTVSDLKLKATLTAILITIDEHLQLMHQSPPLVEYPTHAWAIRCDRGLKQLRPQIN